MEPPGATVHADPWPAPYPTPTLPCVLYRQRRTGPCDRGSHCGATGNGTINPIKRAPVIEAWVNAFAAVADGGCPPVGRIG